MEDHAIESLRNYDIIGVGSFHLRRWREERNEEDHSPPTRVHGVNPNNTAGQAGSIIDMISYNSNLESHTNPSRSINRS